MTLLYKTISKDILRLLEKDDYLGWDVFDGLNSTVFKNTPFYNSRISRLIWIQFFKISPINFRGAAKVEKGHNSKGLALLIQSYLNLYSIEENKQYLEQAYTIANLIIDQSSKNYQYFCAGYNFHWEARAFSVPAYTPNMIVSSFVGQAFLDLYVIDKKEKWLILTREICLFIQNELLLFETDDELCFGYIPGEVARVHNANLMGAKLMARLFSYTNETKFKILATKSVNYSTKAQRQDGAWVYGERGHHQWVDNFHTGFNLVAINDIQLYMNTKKWQQHIELGLLYHINSHFLNDMTPKYYDNKLFPIDIHNFAQGIITFSTFGYPEKALSLLDRCLELMYNSELKYFYYQKTRFFMNKNNYIRWGQSWMLYALSSYILHHHKKNA